MSRKLFSKTNFHSHTFCIWKEVRAESIAGLKPNYQSKSGSSYIFTDSGVYRISNHWGRAANCRWRLKTLNNYKSQQTKIGYADWRDFYPNDPVSKWFYIQVDFATNTAEFYHKDGENYDGKAVLRNAADTMKTLKIIKQVLTETQWAKHLRYDDITILRREVIEQLIYTSNSFLVIKQKHHQ